MSDHSATADRNDDDAEPGPRNDDKDKDNGNDNRKGKGKGSDEKPSPLANPKVRIGLIVLGVVVLVAGVVWFTHYWTRGRYVQSTDDAFLQADQVAISSKIAGYVEEVLVESNQQVEAGQALVRISEQDVRAARDEALAQVAQGVASLKQIEAQLHQQRAQIAVADAQLAGARQTARHAQVEVDRYGPLTAVGAQTAEQLERMRDTRDQALAQVATTGAQRQSAVREIETLRAQIGVAQARIDQARAQLQKAGDDVSSAVLRSSIAGRVGDRSVRVGQYVQPGMRLMTVVPVQSLYLVANFKETQIGLMRVGQPATIEVDALKGEALQGTVESFSPGTGAQFALLPPQNATGNFTKVVQRVPVRIRIDDDPEARKVLLPGLSVTVSVDTIGSKPERKRVANEAKAQRDAREAQHDEAVRRDRDGSQPGPGR